ncbi:MAG: M1 family peptidase [Thiothrix sp.]|nr:MAG: M1 family peptidase [Thiothrix sp.]
MLPHILLLGVFSFWASSVFCADELIHHKLNVGLDPAEHQLKVIDQITLPSADLADPIFYLHRGLQPRSSTPGVKILPVKQNPSVMVEAFKLVLPADTTSFSITYKGTLYHPLEGYGKEQARGFRDTPGVISEEGVYLAGGSYWYPEFDTQTRLRFDLSVKLPKGWQSVSQGEYLSVDNQAHWHSPQPQQEIYLMAARFTQYTRQSDGPTAMVFLREPDEALAHKYLEATDRYLAMYASLLGDYPYQKFALVENFWETGFGMPSFTLLGSSVIRLPFILSSSYPHEILHNWWGNGVYVDYATGNWSEGLTAYLADHLIKEQQGQGAAYRQQSLQKYTDYAAKDRDFPLLEFRGRHSSASEAVGYGKALMLFHMLRRELGDDVFSRGLRAFYKQFQFKTASYEDIRKAFEEATGQSLADYFNQWIQRVGAPALALSNADNEKTTEGYRLSFRLQQKQMNNTYHLRVPVAVTLEGQDKAWQTDIVMNQKEQDYELNLPAKPLRIDIDPEFDLFRKLAREETPAAFSELFGSQQMLVVLPADADADLLKAYEAFAADLQKMGPDNVVIKRDDELESLPQDQAVALMGWSNRFYNDFATALDDYEVSLQGEGVTIAGEALSKKDLSLALTARRSDGEKLPISFIASALPEALPGLGRKLPHYHKYSYLAFTGVEPQNQLKGRWPVTHSPMTVLLEGSAEQAELSKRQALVQPPAEFDANRMMETVRFLSGLN